MCVQQADNLDAAYFQPAGRRPAEYIKASSAIPDSTVKGWKLTASRITTAASVMRCRLLRHGGGARIRIVADPDCAVTAPHYTRNG